MFIIIILTVVTSFFYKNSQENDSVVLAMTETTRVAAISNVDNSSRLHRGELFILKPKFEEDFKRTLEKNKNINLKGSVNYTFDYLNSDTGSLKAIKVIMKNKDKVYQATYKVDISPN